MIINTIIAEVFSVSNKEIVKKKDAWVRTNQELEEKQIKASAESARERNLSLKIREDIRKVDDRLRIMEKKMWTIFGALSIISFIVSPVGQRVLGSALTPVPQASIIQSR